MLELHPNILTKDGKPQFAVLPYEEFLALQERLADLEDLQDLRVAKQLEANAPTLSLAETKLALDNE